MPSSHELEQQLAIISSQLIATKAAEERAEAERKAIEEVERKKAKEDKRRRVEGKKQGKKQAVVKAELEADEAEDENQAAVTEAVTASGHDGGSGAAGRGPCTRCIDAGKPLECLYVPSPTGKAKSCEQCRSRKAACLQPGEEHRRRSRQVKVEADEGSASAAIQVLGKRKRKPTPDEPEESESPGAEESVPEQVQALQSELRTLRRAIFGFGQTVKDIHSAIDPTYGAYLEGHVLSESEEEEEEEEASASDWEAEVRGLEEEQAEKRKEEEEKERKAEQAKKRKEQSK
ncbi:hypothetical protein BJ138DRAFT_1106058 [Hygrophoropsis aurantiaca]|uniref:Uncharacterized protein n=1 Tax=Hygrophoropsis aurantiaca TaxID=72124 RepID=A0ACB7ZVU7_9AGAM|nr:hypothetical protein BJ138DRAFT_1106058 [Hygrophoropsis aurantiaca]